MEGRNRMKHKIFTLCLITLFIFIACSQQAPLADNTLTEQEKTDGWILLFDGSSTSGWRGYNEPEIGAGWVVMDGILVCMGKGGDIGGDIIAEAQYDNFELYLEWNIAKGGNSGIFYHVVEGPQYDAAYKTGPEYQLIDDTGYPGDLEDWQQAGADYAMYAASDQKILNPAGEWNSSRIIFDNGHVEHWLNGVKVVEFQAWSEDWNQRREAGKWKDVPDYGAAKTGLIGLQDHGNMVWFRNIKIKKL